MDAPRSHHRVIDPAAPLAGAHIVVAVGGGIAAYKAAEIVRLLTKADATVQVVMTDHATQFMAPQHSWKSERLVVVRDGESRCTD